MESLREIQGSRLAYWAHMLTLRCNAKCPYCIVHERGTQAIQKELSGKEVLDWWNNIEHKQRRTLSLIGGEPTLYRDLIEVINNLDGYAITLTTNCIGSFFKNREYKKFRPQSTSGLRINTSFHPKAISPEEYISHVLEMREVGAFVDQTAYVDVPNNEYKKEIEEVNKTIPLLPQPFLGFWSKEDKFDAPRKPEFLFPNEKYWDQKRALDQCGEVFRNGYDFYRGTSGQEESKTTYCPHIILALLVSPTGFCYSCHHKLYHSLDSICSIKNYRSEIYLEDLTCSHFGFCTSCDINRLYYGKRYDVVTVDKKKVEWFREII